MESHLTESVDPDEPVVDLAILAPGTLVAGRYAIEELVGTGGFARVYAARDLELGQRVAIKILRTERVTPAGLTRLRREVTLARELARESMVRVYDLGQDGEHIFLTMELVEGETLRDRIARGTLSIDEVVRIAQPILDALGALHSGGVVHRDLKPANILLTSDGAVKLGDFGLARRWEGGEKVTRTEALVGTLEYVAPEQALGQKLDGRADLYAFGVLLFELLAGKLPLEAATNLGTVMAHIISAAPDVRTIRKDVPAWLAELIQQLMEKEPDARPATAALVLATMRARKRDLRWRWRKSRVRVAVIAATCLGIVAACLWGWSAYWREFDHFESYPPHALRAFDRRGRALWESQELLLGASAAVAKIDGEHQSLVGIPRAAISLLPLEQSHRLSVFDVQTGEVTKQFNLTQAAERFAFDRTYGLGGVWAVDPDHDGREDLVVTYTHSPYWPSYSVYADPRTSESTPIFIASGHHRLAGTADIDGDGFDELFFAGSNNRMGWFAGIAAVKLVRSAQTVATGSPWVEACTPDGEYARAPERALLWYSLQPRLNEYAGRLVGVDPAKRILRFEFRSGTVIELTFDGFVAGSSGPPPADRARARGGAYKKLRDGLRTAEYGAWGDALALVQSARALATTAGEPPLAEWAATNEAILLARADRPAEAERLFDELVETSDLPSEICWQAGQVFESTGELERSARFLRRGIATVTGEVHVGRGISAFFEPLALVMAQQGRWEEAQREFDGYSRSFPEDHMTLDFVRTFIAWRRGATVTAKTVSVPSQQESYSYWSFEGRWANGVDDPEAFLREISELRKLKPNLPYLYDSLESEILARMGRTAEAKTLAAKALAATTEAAKSEMAARAHLEIVRERAARLGVLAPR